MMMRRNFTLVEMMTVVFILMILMSFSIPSLTKIKRYALQANCVSNLRQISEAWIAYTEGNRGRFPYLKDNDVTNLPGYKEPSDEGGDGVSDASPGIWESSDRSYGARGRALEVLLAPYQNVDGGWSEVWLCKAAKPYRKICIDENRPSPWTTRYSDAPSWRYRDCGSYEGLSVLYARTTDYNRVREGLNVNYVSQPHRAPIQWCATIRNTKLFKPQYTWIDGAPAIQTKTPVPTKPEDFEPDSNGFTTNKQNALGRYGASSWHGYDEQLAMGPRPTVFLDGHVSSLKYYGHRAHCYDDNPCPYSNGPSGVDPGGGLGGIPPSASGYGSFDVPSGMHLGVLGGLANGNISSGSWGGSFPRLTDTTSRQSGYTGLWEWRNIMAKPGECLLDEY